MEKKCSKCGVIFICQNETRGCWCEQFTLSAEMLQYLKEHYANCLCSECLNELSQEKEDLYKSENQ